MTEIQFADQSVTYDAFLADLKLMISDAIRQMLPPKQQRLTKRQAEKRYGRANVDRWYKSGNLQPVQVTPGKIYFSITDLDNLDSQVQNYLIKI